MNWDLTPRELEVLKCATEGMGTSETAKFLFIEPQTVKFHRTHIFQKLEAKNINTRCYYCF